MVADVTQFILLPYLAEGLCQLYIHFHFNMQLSCPLCEAENVIVMTVWFITFSFGLMFIDIGGLGGHRAHTHKSLHLLKMFRIY